MTEITTLTPAQSKSESLRTTVPASIVRQFRLTAKDQLSWDMEPRENQIVVVVRPVKAERGAAATIRSPSRKGQRGTTR